VCGYATNDRYEAVRSADNTDILKAHRAHHLFHNHRLFQIPLASEALEESFGGQVTCSEHVCDVKPEDVLVLFVHDLYVCNPLCVVFSSWDITNATRSLKSEGEMRADGPAAIYA
jgi:hypothetical protein